jgi:CTP:molybdopterin cytidylyltransferase MocA
VLDAVTESGLEPVVLVVGHRGDAVARHARAGVLPTTARRWREGIAASLRTALRQLEPLGRVTAVCIGLADQPLVGADAYRRLAAAHRSGAQLAVATYGGQRANPVLLGRPLWADAQRLRGDIGARALMSDHVVVEVDCTGTGDPSDVDTLGDLRALEEGMDRP